MEDKGETTNEKMTHGLVITLHTQERHSKSTGTRLFYRVKGWIVIIWVAIHGGHMASLLVPLAMIIISHDSNPIKVLTQHRDVIACRKGEYTVALPRGNSRVQKHSGLKEKYQGLKIAQ